MSIPNITVRRQDTPLTARKWTFCLIDRSLRCVGYRALSKPTARHKSENVTAGWSWYTDRVENRIPAHEVPWDESVAAEAMAELVAMFSVVPPVENDR